MIVLVGSMPELLSYLLWYRRLGGRAKALLLSCTEYPGAFRRLLPYVALGYLKPWEAVLLRDEHVRLQLCCATRYSPDERVELVRRGVVAVDGEEVEYERLVIALGWSCTKVREGCIVELRRVEDAIHLKELLERYDNVGVIGGLEGAWLASILADEGYNVTLYMKEVFQQPFDDEIISLAMSRAKPRFKITRWGGHLSEKLGIVYDLDSPRVPRGLKLGALGGIAVDEAFVAEESIVVLGGSAEWKDPTTGIGLVSISDETSIMQSIVAILRQAGMRAPAPQRVYLTRIGDVFVLSAGITSKEAQKAGLEVSSSRVNLKSSVANGGSIVIKLVARRSDGRVLGFQAVGGAEVLKLTPALLITLLGRLDATTLLLAMEPAALESYFPGALAKVAHGVWVKMHRGHVAITGGKF